MTAERSSESPRKRPLQGALAGTEIVVRAGYLTAVNASTGTALRVVRMPARREAAMISVVAI